MLLVIDIGNTNVTTGLIRSGALVATRRMGTDPRITSDALEVALAGLLALDAATFADLTAIACASVVPALATRVEAVAARRDLPLTMATPGTVPIPVRVERPAEVGADRLVNALAAGRLYGAPAVVVDLGTATTFDAVDRDGAYVGGAIAPGLELGLEALATKTAQLPRVALRMPDRVIGRDTVSAIQAGAVAGHHGMVTALLARTRRELADAAAIEPRAVTAILTGGLAAAPWAASIPDVDAIDPDLTLKGLALLHAEVAGGERLELGLS